MTELTPAEQAEVERFGIFDEEVPALECTVDESGGMEALAAAKALILDALGIDVDALPAPVEEWEYAEFDGDELLADGTLHEWAEPKDVWDHPLPADELAELRAEGGVYARRPKPRPWLPVDGEGDRG